MTMFTYANRNSSLINQLFMRLIQIFFCCCIVTNNMAAEINFTSNFCMGNFDVLSSIFVRKVWRQKFLTRRKRKVLNTKIPSSQTFNLHTIIICEKNLFHPPNGIKFKAKKAQIVFAKQAQVRTNGEKVSKNSSIERRIELGETTTHKNFMCVCRACSKIQFFVRENLFCQNVFHYHLYNAFINIGRNIFQRGVIKKKIWQGNKV